MQGSRGEVFISDDPDDAKIIAGFRLNTMNMRDAGSGKVLWESPPEWVSRVHAAVRACVSSRRTQAESRLSYVPAG